MFSEYNRAPKNKQVECRVTYTNKESPHAQVIENISNFRLENVSQNQDISNDFNLLGHDLSQNTSFEFKVGSGGADLSRNTIYDVSLQLVNKYEDNTGAKLIGFPTDNPQYHALSDVWGVGNRLNPTNVSGLVTAQEPSGIIVSVTIDGSYNQFRNNGLGTIIQFTTGDNYYGDELPVAQGVEFDES